MTADQPPAKAILSEEEWRRDFSAFVTQLLRSNTDAAAIIELRLLDHDAALRARVAELKEMKAAHAGLRAVNAALVAVKANATEQEVYRLNGKLAERDRLLARVAETMQHNLVDPPTINPLDITYARVHDERACLLCAVKAALEGGPRDG